MKILTLIAGLLTIIISLVTQLSALIDDSYSIGNIWFIGVASGILTVIGSRKINKNEKISLVLLIFSVILGFVSILYFYIVPALLNLIPIIYLCSKLYLNRTKKKG